MRIIVCDDLAALNKAGADEIARVVAQKPTTSVVLATGNSPMGIYDELSARTALGEFDATSLRVFQLDEYFAIEENDSRSLYGWMDRKFLQPMHVPARNVVRLTGGADHREVCAAYDKAVREAGGFDLAVLGLGPNGHLGFNEPGSHAHSRTRALLLSEESLNSNAAYWGSRAAVPLAAITCGLQNLLEARCIILVVSGKAKREILEKALHGPIGPEVPASYLQTVADRLIVICDKQAMPGTEIDDPHDALAAELVTAPAVVARPDLVLGVDAGNTKTVALVATTKGEIVGWGRSGCGDMYGAGPEGSLAAVNSAVQTALDMAGAAGSQVGSGAFCMAGADWPEDYELLYRLLREKRLASKVIVHNDSVGALRAGSPAGWGASVVAGTWLCAAARAPGGEFLRGFWTPGGGGGALAYAAIEAVYRADLGMGPPTKLTERVLAFFGVDSVQALAHAFTKREGPHPHQAVPRLAPHVLDVAAEGDVTACGIVIEQGRALGDVALSMARQVGIEHRAFPLVLAGGVFRHQSSLLSDSLAGTVQRFAPRARIIKSDVQPVAGAVMLALDEVGQKVTAKSGIRRRMIKTMPASSFFAT